jgi:hypothetical protein
VKALLLLPILSGANGEGEGGDFTGVVVEVEENPQESQLEEEEEVVVEVVGSDGSTIGISVPTGVTPAKEVRNDLVSEELCGIEGTEEVR